MTYQGLLASPGLGRRINASPRVVGKVVGAITKQTDAVVPEYAAQFAPRFSDPARGRAASQVYRTFQLYEYPRWVRGLYADRRLTTPTLWLHGISDPFFKPGMFRDIVDHADDVRIEYLPDCGHFPQEEQPALVAEHLRDFFM
jgi:pimeloyl-ACP methyl ester carboxylesterase